MLPAPVTTDPPKAGAVKTTVPDGPALSVRDAPAFNIFAPPADKTTVGEPAPVSIKLPPPARDSAPVLCTVTVPPALLDVRLPISVKVKPAPTLAVMEPVERTVVFTLTRTLFALTETADAFRLMVVNPPTSDFMSTSPPGLDTEIVPDDAVIVAVPPSIPMISGLVMLRFPEVIV